MLLSITIMKFNRQNARKIQICLSEKSLMKSHLLNSIQRKKPNKETDRNF